MEEVELIRAENKAKIELMQKFAPTEQSRLSLREGEKLNIPGYFNITELADDDRTFQLYPVHLTETGHDYTCLAIFEKRSATVFDGKTDHHGRKVEAYCPAAIIIQKDHEAGRGEGVFFSVQHSVERIVQAGGYFLNMAAAAATLKADVIINSERFGGWPHRSEYGYWSDRTAEMLGKYTPVINKMGHRNDVRQLRNPNASKEEWLFGEAMCKKLIANTFEELGKNSNYYVKAGAVSGRK